MQKQIEAKEKQLSFIIPVLLYHGKGKWEYRTLGDLFKNIEPEWQRFLPNFDFVYNNLGDLSDEQPRRRTGGGFDNKFLAASLLALKHTFDKEWLEVNILRLFSLPQQVPENLLSKFIVYIFESSGFKEEQIIMTIETLPVAIKNTVMSTLDIFIEKGKKIGRQEGVDETLFKNTQNMLLEGFSLDTICKVLEVTPDYVARVQKELN